MAIVPYLNPQTGVFDPEVTRAMSAAFEELCATLNVPAHATGARELIADKIINLVRDGEHNADQLRDRVLREYSSSANGFSGC